MYSDLDACYQIALYVLRDYTSLQAWLHECMTCAVSCTGTHAYKDLMLGRMFLNVPILKFLMILEQETPYFYFVLVPPNYVAGPASMRKPGEENKHHIKNILQW